MTNEDKYDWLFKRQALDAVLREYGAFFRLSRHSEDTRTVFLLTLCAMIDLAKSQVNLDRENSQTYQHENQGSALPDPWDLDGLLKEDSHYFSHVNWPCNDRLLNANQCYKRMLVLLRDSPFF